MYNHVFVHILVKLVIKTIVSQIQLGGEQDNLIHPRVVVIII